MSRYAGINIVENMVDNRSLSTDEITNSYAELSFYFKKLDQNKINLPLCKYIKENNNIHIALQRKFIDKLTKNTYKKGPTKRQGTTMKQAFIKNYGNIDDKYYLVPSLEIEIGTGTPKNEIKKEKDKSFHLHQQLLQILQKSFPKHLLAKAEENTH